MDAAQFQQFLAAMQQQMTAQGRGMAQAVAEALPAAAPAAQGGGKRLTPFSSGEPSDWIAWKRVFENTRTLKGWNDVEAKNQLVAAMEGMACRNVADIPTDGEDVTWKTLMAAYSNRFLPPATGKAARRDFAAARQVEKESMVQWHTRVRETFLRAYPEQNAEESIDLIEKFLFGIYNPRVREGAVNENPDTMTAALNVAVTKSANLLALRESDGFRGRGYGIMAVNGEPADGSIDAIDKDCYNCGQRGHLQRDCPRRRRSANDGRFQPRSWSSESTSTRSGRGRRGTGGRGGGGGRGGRGRAGRRSRNQARMTEVQYRALNAMVDALKLDEGESASATPETNADDQGN